MASGHKWLTYKAANLAHHSGSDTYASPRIRQTLNLTGRNRFCIDILVINNHIFIDLIIFIIISIIIVIVSIFLIVVIVDCIIIKDLGLSVIDIFSVKM